MVVSNLSSILGNSLPAEFPHIMAGEPFPASRDPNSKVSKTPLNHAIQAPKAEKTDCDYTTFMS